MSKKTHVSARNHEKSIDIHHHEYDHPVLPPPEVMKKYEETYTGAFKWVLVQTEEESKHRRKRSLLVNCFTFINICIGQIFGLIIGILGLTISAYLALHGAQTTAAIIGGSTVLGLTGSFLSNSKK